MLFLLILICTPRIMKKIMVYFFIVGRPRMEEAKKKNNIILDFITSFIYIPVYSLLGIKFILWDMWVMLFNYFAWQLDKTVNGKADKVETKEEQELLYQKTKGRKKKKQRVYNYSKRTLARYEKMKIELANDLRTSGATRSKTPNVYQFTVRNVQGDGQIFTATMSGLSKLDINAFLVNKGYEVYQIKTSKLINFLNADSSFISREMSKKDLIFFLTQLSTYLKAGITLNEGMKILTTQMNKNKNRQRVFESICYELQLGETFSNALAKQGNLFPALLINMIKAAEATGTLQETLDDMANYYTEVNNTHKEMVSALTYPAIIMIFAVAVVTFIVVYVVPQFSNIYDTMGLTISGMTLFLINLSAFLTNNLFLVIMILVVLILVNVIMYKKVKMYRVFIQEITMKLPVIKNIIIYNEIAIFAKTFASLLRNNVFITESMGILSKITNNEIYKAIMYKTIDNIVMGEKISDAFKDHWAVPDVAYYMIVTGESTGQLADMMQKVSDYYQVMHKNTVNALKSLVEPVMIVFLAIVVGGILLAVIVPMFSAYNQIL